MFNDITLNGSVLSNQTLFLLSKLFPGHPIPNTNYTVNVRAINMASAGPPSITETSPTTTLGMYPFDNVHTYMHTCIESYVHMYICVCICIQCTNF